MDTPSGKPETTPATQPSQPSGKWTVKQYPRRLPGSYNADPINEAILVQGKEEKVITGTYDEVIAEVKQLTGATK